jgi:hypothetical protein
VKAASTFAHPQQSTPDFDALAPIYRWMEWASFGPCLWLCRCAFLPEMLSRQRALVIGDGDGRFTARLLQDNQAICVDAVDGSAAMLRALEERSKTHTARLQTECIDAREWNAGARHYDLIVTHFFLDCLTTDEVLSLAQQVRAAALPGALWVVSEFAIPQGRFGRFIARPLIRVLYTAFRQMTGLRVDQLPNHHQALSDCGFQLHARKLRLAGLLISEIWTMESRQ